MQQHEASLAESVSRPLPAETGRLRDAPMPALLWRLHTTARTGCLRVRKGALEKCVWLVDGAPVFARSNEAGDRLTDRLLARGLLSRSQYDQAQDLLAHAAGSGKRIGQLLLDAGLIRERELHEALSEQIQWMLESMFSWTEGTWSFEPGPPPDRITLDRPTAAIIMNAARHRIPLRRLWDGVGHHDLCPLLDGDYRTDDGRGVLAAALLLEPSETAWLARLDGSRSLTELLDDFDVDEHELLALLYTLKLVGHLQLEVAEPPAFAFHR
ncbi:MAG TPA: DUF4388 domain-containing protein [Nannocystis sp.]